MFKLYVNLKGTVVFEYFFHPKGVRKSNDFKTDSKNF